MWTFGISISRLPPRSSRVFVIILESFTRKRKVTQRLSFSATSKQLRLKKKKSLLLWNSVQFSSVAQSCLTLWDTTRGLPVHHQFPELTQTHVHWVSDAIQPSHPLSSPSPSTFKLFQHQDLFQWVSSLHQVAKVLELQLQHIQDWFPLGWTGWVSLQFKGLSRVFSNTTVQKHQFFSA